MSRPVLVPEAVAAVPGEVLGVFCPACSALAGQACRYRYQAPRVMLGDEGVHTARVVRALTEAIARRGVPSNRGERRHRVVTLRRALSAIAAWRDDDGRELDSAAAIAIAQDALDQTVAA